MTTRILKSKEPSKVSRAPKSHHEWDNLMRQVIMRARTQGDARHSGLQGVIPRGHSAKVLRKMGIICEADIQREFPDKKR